MQEKQLTREESTQQKELDTSQESMPAKEQGTKQECQKISNKVK